MEGINSLGIVQKEVMPSDQGLGCGAREVGRLELLRVWHLQDSVQDSGVRVALGRSRPDKCDKNRQGQRSTRSWVKAKREKGGQDGGLAI